MIYVSLGSLTVQLFKFLRTVFTPNLSLKYYLVDQLPPASLNNGGPLFSTPHPRELGAAVVSSLDAPVLAISAKASL